ncbi:hypothetical protein G6M89_09160 [Natronolimnobius sp. AArcel1]|uniref:hypothetical protein n=1 Tax=Natronolimnobius sp. AArcel1 TaxID=1679093 RepID=UPI0013EA9122|nr:hypothetical protein [Natronolimnobius sp. AArcel1]NGM69172.1 hypothetical protein [Natronolimnobius sp. AArcel1]
MAEINGLEDEIVEEGHFIVPDSVEDKECWYTYVEHEERGKIPCSPHSLYPSWIDGANPDEDELVTFQEALEAVEKSRAKHGHDDGLTGVMLALSADVVPDLAVIDIDDCVGPESGEMTELAANMIEDLDSTFWEVSPSGTGLHGYYFDSKGLDSEYQQKDTLELYTNRGVTFTGRHVKGTAQEIDECPGMIGAYQRMYNDEKYSESDTSDVHEQKLRESVQGREYLDGGLDDESHTSGRGDGVDALSGRTKRVAEAMIQYGDDDLVRLYENGDSRDVWSEWETMKKDEDGNERLMPDRSSAEFSLLMKICWWGMVADMFDFQLDQSEIEEIFLSSDIARRQKCARPDYVSLSAYKAIEKTRRDYLDD